MCSRATILLILWLTGSCSLGYQHDRPFNDWLLAAEARCVERNGALPDMSEKERESFLTLTYDTYYGHSAPEIFADQLAIKYPNHEQVIYCLANAFPRLP